MAGERPGRPWRERCILAALMMTNPNRGDRILFLNVDDRLRAGFIQEIIEDAGQTLLSVSTEDGVQWVPLERLQATVKLVDDMAAQRAYLA